MSVARLWILEDEPNFRGIVTHLAVKGGYEVSEFVCLEDAWKFLKDTSFEFAPAIIISDFHLPDGTSEDWMAEARERFTATKIICVSGGLNSSLKARFEPKRILTLEKPVSISEILNVLGEMEDLTLE